MPTDIWGNVTGGASGSGSVYDTVISTTVWGNAQGGAAGVVNSASNAAARAAIVAVSVGAVSDVIAAQAQLAARQEWVNVTGSAEGFEAHWPGINDQIVSILQRYTPASLIASALPASSLSEFAAKNTVEAAKSAMVSGAASAGIGALLGGSTVLLIGGGILLLVLLKR